MTAPSDKEIVERAKAFKDFLSMTDEEKAQTLSNTEVWLDTFSEEEKTEILEKLRVAADISVEDHEALHYLQHMTARAFDSMDVDSEDVPLLYGYTEEQMQMFARWLDMEVLRYDELNEMSVQDAWVTGVLMGMRLGIMVQEDRDG